MWARSWTLPIQQLLSTSCGKHVGETSRAETGRREVAELRARAAAQAASIEEIAGKLADLDAAADTSEQEYEAQARLQDERRRELAGARASLDANPRRTERTNQANERPAPMRATRTILEPESEGAISTFTSHDGISRFVRNASEGAWTFDRSG